MQIFSWLFSLLSIGMLCGLPTAYVLVYPENDFRKYIILSASLFVALVVLFCWQMRAAKTQKVR